MSGFRYRTIGGSLNPNQFSDAGNRATGPLGQNWFQGIIYNTPFTSPTGFGTFQIGQQVSDGTQGFQALSGGTNNPATILYALAAPMGSSAWPQIYGASQQFVQFTFWEYSSGGGSGSYFGSVLDMQPSAVINGYFFQVNLKTAAQIRVDKFIPNGTNAPGSNIAGSSTVINNATIGIATLVQGDVVRMSVDRATTPGSVIIAVTLNGVQKAQVTDVSPLAVGGPGMQTQASVSGGVGATMGWKNFSCGVGL